MARTKWRRNSEEGRSEHKLGFCYCNWHIPLNPCLDLLTCFRIEPNHVGLQWDCSYYSQKQHIAGKFTVCWTAYWDCTLYINTHLGVFVGQGLKCRFSITCCHPVKSGGLPMSDCRVLSPFCPQGGVPHQTILLIKCSRHSSCFFLFSLICDMANCTNWR